MMKSFEGGQDNIEIRIERALGFHEKKAILHAARSGSPGCAQRVKCLLRQPGAILVAYDGKTPVAVQAVSSELPEEACESKTMILFASPCRRRSLRAQLCVALSLLSISISDLATATPPLAVPLASGVDDTSEKDAEQVPPCEDASAACELRQVDRLFPGAGHVGVTVSSGVPHAALGEVNVGVIPGFLLPRE